MGGGREDPRSSKIMIERDSKRESWADLKR